MNKTDKIHNCFTNNFQYKLLMWNSYDDDSCLQKIIYSDDMYRFIVNFFICFSNQLVDDLES